MCLRVSPPPSLPAFPSWPQEPEARQLVGQGSKCKQVQTRTHAHLSCLLLSEHTNGKGGPGSDTGDTKLINHNICKYNKGLRCNSLRTYNGQGLCRGRTRCCETQSPSVGFCSSFCRAQRQQHRPPAMLPCLPAPPATSPAFPDPIQGSKAQGTAALGPVLGSIRRCTVTNM